MAMASPSKQTCLLFLLFTLSLMHTHARDSQLFNKVPSTTNTNYVPPTDEQQQQQDPTFLPDNENGYGLYGHESGQLPPSATTTTTGESTTTTTTIESKRPLSKYLPKNYNPVAYVTEPENFSDTDTDTNTFADDKSFTTTTATTNGGGQSYYKNQQDDDIDQYKSFSSANNNYNSYYTSGSSFNSQPQGISDTRSYGGATTGFNYGGAGEPNLFRPQGMSDTRSLAKGKYFYDINTERYSRNHPYESLKANARSRDVFGNRNYYGNTQLNSYDFENGNSVNQDEFQD